MENLKTIAAMLKSVRRGKEGNYFIPEAWVPEGYGDGSADEKRKGEISVNPYKFFSACIENSILSAAQPEDAPGTHADPAGGGRDADPGRSVIYSLFPRLFTAWEHYDDGKLYPGTFLKAICLLPYVKSLGADIIYLLPVFKYSGLYKKGGLGSPYAIKNIYRLDENLHDPLLGELTEDVLETQFKAFVEACHMLGMKVMLDFVFRTVSRDNDLIAEHPDWFYWIGLEHAADFAAPAIDGVKGPVALNGRSLRRLYKAKGIKEYLAGFVRPPKETDPEKWEVLLRRHARTGESLLELVEAEFGMTTVPGFSDVINDRQPPWTDVTYLKFFHDIHREARRYVGEEQPPYIMQDGVRLNLYHGELENKELRSYISGVIPYYQEKYGIDGARIDMGHALAPELNREIVAKAKEEDGGFILWSEEFDAGKSGAAKNDGFHFISGFTWSIYKDLEKPYFNRRLLSDTLMKAEIPVTAALETPDTPRAALVHGDKRKIELLVLLNCFIPNAIPFINNGLELLELQPMNLGLDNTEEGRFVLESEDPMYGRLAFFDNCSLHWLSGDREWMQGLLSCAFGLRKRFIGVISAKDNYVENTGSLKNKKLTFTFYFDRQSRKGVFFLANRSFGSRARISPAKLIPERIINGCKAAAVVYAGGGACETAWPVNRNRLLEPGEVIIGEVNYERKI